MFFPTLQPTLNHMCPVGFGARLLRLRFSQDLVRLNEAVCRCKCGSREIEQAWSQAFVCLVLRVLDVVAVHEIPGLVLILHH